MKRCALLLVLILALAVGVTAQRGPYTLASPAPNDLFRLTAMTDVHLELTKADFDGLAPHGGGFFSGLFGGGGGGGGNSKSWLLGAEGKRNGFGATQGIEFDYVHASVTIAGRTVKNIGLRYKGNGTYVNGSSHGKVSLKMDFAEYVKGQRLDTLKKLNLHSNFTDATWMNEPLAFELYRDAGVPAPRSSYARVYMTVPGKHDHAYLGLFSIVENADEVFAASRGWPVSGAIFKPVTTSLFTYFGADWKAYNQTYDPKTTLTAAQQKRVIDFSRIVTSGSEEEFRARAPEYLDLENLSRYLAVTVFLSDMDGILGSGQNYYLYLDPRTDKFTFIAWDQDHSFGQFFRGSQSSREQLSIQHPWSESSKFFDRLFALDAFKKLYLARLTEFSTTLFKPERFFKKVDDLAVFLRPAVKDESSYRLQRFDAAVAGQVPPGQATGGFQGSNIPIKPFVKARAQSVIDQLAGRSEGKRINGR